MNLNYWEGIKFIAPSYFSHYQLDVRFVLYWNWLYSFTSTNPTLNIIKIYMNGIICTLKSEQAKLWLHHKVSMRIPAKSSLLKTFLIPFLSKFGLMPDYIVIMPGFAFLILNVAKSLTSDGLVLVAGGREGWRPKFNCDWLASEWCSQCILWVRGGSNLKMSRWQWMLTMEPSSSSSSLLQILFQTIPYFSKAEELILFANFYEIHLDPVSLSEICIH